MNILYEIGKFLLRVIFLTTFDFRLYGQGNVPKTGGILIAANHQSFLDPILLGIGFPRTIRFMARQSLFKNPLFGAIIRGVGVFPVSRGRVDRQAIRKAVELLDSGEVILMFPEGTRSHDGSLGQIRNGPIMIAARSEVPIVPMVVEGTFCVWPRHRRFPRMGRVRACIGQPITQEEISTLSRAELASVLRERLLGLQQKLQNMPRS